MLLSTNLLAVDFREMALGGRCQDISANEMAKGGKITAEKNVFLGQHLGMDVSITYGCHAGYLVRGTYTFWFNDYQKAKLFFHQNKPHLVKEYGRPTVDQADTGYLDYMASIGFEIKDAHRYVLLWQTPQWSITYGVNKMQGEESVSWVSIDIIQTE